MSKHCHRLLRPCDIRSSEVLNAEWNESDLEKKVWTIPVIRMMGGHAKGKPLSGMAMTMQLRRMKREDITVHGFRSTFRDSSSEQTSFPHECQPASSNNVVVLLSAGTS